MRYERMDIVRTGKAKKHKVYDHYFCAYCGKELTKLDYKTGYLKQQQHIIGYTAEGLQIRLCWQGNTCEKRHDEKNRSRL